MTKKMRKVASAFQVDTIVCPKGINLKMMIAGGKSCPHATHGSFLPGQVINDPQGDELMLCLSLVKAGWMIPVDGIMEIYDESINAVIN